MLGRWSRRSRYPKDLRDAGRPDDPLFERPLVHGRIDSGVVTVRRPGSDEIEVYHVPAKRKGESKVNAAEKPDFDPPVVRELIEAATRYLAVTMRETDDDPNGWAEEEFAKDRLREVLAKVWGVGRDG